VLAGPYCDALRLQSQANRYEYLSCSGCSAVDGVNDSQEFEVTLGAMRSVGMNNSQIQSFLSLIAGILHLGNVKFQVT